MSLCPLRNVRLIPLSEQDWRGGGSGVIAEVEPSRGQNRRLPPPPLEKLPSFSLGHGDGWSKEWPVVVLWLSVLSVVVLG